MPSKTYQEFMQEIENFRDETLFKIHEVAENCFQLEGQLIGLYYERILKYNIFLLEKIGVDLGVSERILTMRKLYLNIVDSVEPDIKRIEDEYDKQKTLLRSIVPPDKFLERFGWAFYKFFKEAHPDINMDTKVEDWPSNSPELYYAIPQMFSVWDVKEFSPEAKLDVGKCQFERYGLRHTGLAEYVEIHTFAWADQINTIFVGDKS